MTYQSVFDPPFKKKLKKIFKKDRGLYERVMKKIEQIVSKPKHYKPLKYDLKGTRGVHVDPFVIIFKIDEENIVFLEIDKHDKALGLE
jgi:YafQ family addiction module toxin component